MSNIIFNQPMKYKKICAMMGDEEKKNSASRKRQLNRWSKKYVIEKNKTWYTCKRELTKEEIEYNLQKEKQNKPCRSKYKTLFEKYNKNSDVIDFNFARFHGGVYKFQFENIVYIGQTNNFFTRFIAHMRESQETEAGKLLLKGGYYEILAVEEDLEQRLALEKKYIKMYVENNDYICINDDFNSSKKHKARRKRKYYNFKIKIEDYEKVVDLLEREGIVYE